MKEVKKDSIGEVKSFYLTIYSYIKQGLNPKEVCLKLNMSKQRVNYYIRQLKAKGLIEKIGYGTWKTTSKQVKINTLSSSSTLPPKKGIKEIRSHGYRFTLKLKKITNWDKREDYLRKNGINFKPLKGAGNKIKVVIEDFSLWLCNNSIVVIFPKNKSYFTKSAKEGNEFAALDFFRIIKKLETLLKIDFTIRGKYQFKPFLQHHALIKNELARLYNKPGKKKLFVYDEKGLWLLVDNSFNLHELETISPVTATKDMDDVVKPFFNDLKTREHYKPGEAKELIDAVAKNQGELYNNFDNYNKNIVLHLRVLSKIEKAITKLDKKLGEDK